MAKKRRRPKTATDGRSARLRWRLELRRWTQLAIDMQSQLLAFDASFAQDALQETAETYPARCARYWFSFFAVITLRRVIDEKYPSLMLTLSQIAKRPNDAIDFSSGQIDMVALRADRERLAKSFAKILDVANNEFAHDKASVPIERRPQFGDIRVAIQVLFETATKYDALFSGLTLMPQADNSRLPVMLAGNRFEDIGVTAAWNPPSRGETLHDVLADEGG